MTSKTLLLACVAGLIKGDGRHEPPDMCSHAALAHQGPAEAHQRMATTHSTGTFLVGSVKLLI